MFRPFLTFTLMLCWSIATAASGATPAKLAVSADGRFLTHADGKAFLWIADTAWHLADTLGREDIRFYLDERQRSGFTAIQAAVFMGHPQPQPIGQTRNPANACGHRPFSGGDEPDTARAAIGPDGFRRVRSHRGLKITASDERVFAAIRARFESNRQ